jgi:ribosomal protein S18 acetylase RimI-like enzyme
MLINFMVIYRHANPAERKVCQDAVYSILKTMEGTSDYKELMKSDNSGLIPEGYAVATAKEDGKIVGVSYGCKHDTLENCGRLGLIIVHPDYRKRGIGTELALMVMDKLKGESEEIDLTARPITRGGFAIDKKLGFRFTDSGFSSTEWDLSYSGRKKK